MYLITRQKSIFGPKGTRLEMNMEAQAKPGDWALIYDGKLIMKPYDPLCNDPILASITVPHQHRKQAIRCKEPILMGRG